MIISFFWNLISNDKVQELKPHLPNFLQEDAVLVILIKKVRKTVESEPG